MRLVFSDWDVHVWRVQRGHHYLWLSTRMAALTLRIDADRNKHATWSGQLVDKGIGNSGRRSANMDHLVRGCGVSAMTRESIVRD